MKNIKSKFNFFLNFLKKNRASKKKINFIDNFQQKIFNKIRLYKWFSLIKEKIIKITKPNILILVLSLVVFLYLILISIPGIIYDKKIQNYLTKILKENYQLNFALTPEISYSILPKPHFEIRDAVIFVKKGEYQKNLAQIKKLKLFLDQRNILNNNLKINSIELINSNFFLMNTDLLFFNDLIKNNFFNKPIKIKKSNFFYNDENNNTISLLKFSGINIFKDKPKNHHIIHSKGEIFNIPFNFNWKKDLRENESITNINLKKIRLDIVNFVKKISDDEKSSEIRINLNKSKFYINYILENRNFNFSSKKSYFGKAKFIYEGDISLDPFSFEINSSLEKIDLVKLYNNNILFEEILSTNFLLNKNFNGNFKIQSDKLVNNPLFEKMYANLNFVGKTIDFSNTKIFSEKIANLKIDSGILYEEQNNIVFKGTFTFNILDQKRFYNKFVVPKKNRINIDKIKFGLLFNINKKDLKILNFNIPGLKIKNDKLDNLIYEFNNEGGKITNWIELKNFTNRIISFYSG